MCTVKLCDVSTVQNALVSCASLHHEVHLYQCYCNGHCVFTVRYGPSVNFPPNAIEIFVIILPSKLSTNAQIFSPLLNDTNSPLTITLPSSFPVLPPFKTSFTRTDHLYQKDERVLPGTMTNILFFRFSPPVI